MPDPITRLNSALEGRYRIERELGQICWDGGPTTCCPTFRSKPSVVKVVW